ncbi:MAG: hypothetical protein KC766_10630 [Myxococcales bacterium]|nr:hypothetical protein [Myxococcales bacterium]
MRSLTWLCFPLLLACQRQSETLPVASSAASEALPVASASSGSSCATIRRDLRREQARLAKQPQRCETDADCDLYGGHECPNALVRVCPDAVAKSSLRALRPLEDAWERNHCGEILWSPYQREATCESGLCRGVSAP